MDNLKELRKEHAWLNNELAEHYFSMSAKASLLDVIISEGYILQSTLDKCIAQLDEIDRKELESWKN